MDPITMALGLLVTQIMSSKKKDGFFGNLLYPGNPFSSFRNEKVVEDYLDKKEVSKRLTIPVHLNKIGFVSPERRYEAKSCTAAENVI